MTRIAMALILMALSVVVAQAGTNLPALADYPAPSCIKPEKPAPPGQVTVQVVPMAGGSVKTVSGDTKDYNEQVAHYNTALHDYTACTNDYVANAQADMNLIRDKANKAVLAGQEPALISP